MGLADNRNDDWGSWFSLLGNGEPNFVNNATELIGKVVTSLDMTFKKYTLALSYIFFTVASSSGATTYIEVFSYPSATNQAGFESDARGLFLDAVAAKGDKAYGFVRVNGGGAIIEYDGASDSMRTVTSNSQWNAASLNTLGGFHGAAVAGSNIVFSNTFDNQSYKVDIATGEVSTLASQSDFNSLTGGSVNLTAASAFTSAGNGFVLDGTSDSIIGIGVNGSVSSVIGTADLASLASMTSGMLGASDNALYLGSNNTDTIYKWDLVSETGSTLFTTAEIESLTDDVDGRVGFAGFVAAPDGRGYFYESDSDYLMSFDLANPSGSLRVELTEAELNDGPAANDRPGQLTWYGGELAWTIGREGFYAVPEPSSSVILGLVGILCLVNRKRV